MEGYVSVKTGEYDELLANANFLFKLVENGVRDWSGYDAACEAYHEGASNGKEGS